MNQPIERSALWRRRPGPTQASVMYPFEGSAAQEIGRIHDHLIELTARVGRMPESAAQQDAFRRLEKARRQLVKAFDAIDG